MMNTELIKKIRREAIIKWVANHGITVHKFGHEPEDIESLEIFTEYIVKECINKIETYHIPVGNSPAGEMAGEMACEMAYHALRNIVDDIKEHFGME